MRAYKAGNSRTIIQIQNDWLVLDVGSGHNPHPRANILLDRNIGPHQDRSGRPCRIDKPIVLGDACSLPFKDKSVDYIIASHIAEHMDEPHLFCGELMRVGKKGYIETPSKVTEALLSESVHKWYVYMKRGSLVFEKKRKPHPLGLIGKLFYSLFYLNQERLGRTIYFRNKYARHISTKLVGLFIRVPWVKARKITYTCFEWNGYFKYKVIKRNISAGK